MIRNAEAAARCLTVVLGIFQLRSKFRNSLPAIHDIACLYFLQTDTDVIEKSLVRRQGFRGAWYLGTMKRAGGSPRIH